MKWRWGIEAKGGYLPSCGRKHMVGQESRGGNSHLFDDIHSTSLGWALLFYSNSEFLLVP